MYAFSSKSGSEPFRAFGDLTWNDPMEIVISYFIVISFYCHSLSLYLKMFNNFYYLIMQIELANLT